MEHTDWDQQLRDAVKNGDAAAAQTALTEGADPDLTDHNDNSLVMLAISSEHADVAEVLIKNGADPDQRDSNDYTPLIFAALSGYTDLVKTLVEANAELNAQETDGYTALHFASLHGFSEIVDILLEAEADTELQTEQDGYTPLILATLSEHEYIVDELIEHDTDVDITDHHDLSALDVALTNENDHMIRALIVAGSEIDNLDEETREKYAAEIETADKLYRTYRAINDQIVLKDEADISDEERLFKIFNFEAKTVTPLVNDTPGQPQSFSSLSNAKSAILEAYEWMREQGHDTEHPFRPTQRVIRRRDKRSP